MGYVETKNFRVLYFSLGAAVLDSEFRANHESGLRLEQSSAGQIDDETPYFETVRWSDEWWWVHQEDNDGQVLMS